MAVPPVARISDTCGWRMNIAVRVRLARSTDWSSSTGARCAASTSPMSSTVRAPTSAAAGWWLTIRALRALRQIRVLNTSVATGLVIGMRPSTTPTGLAISVTPRSSGGRGPIPGRPWRARFTSRLAKRFLKVLSATLPIPVSATVAAASSSAWPATAPATPSSSASTRSSGQPASTAWAAAAAAHGGVDRRVDVGREHVLLQVAACAPGPWRRRPGPAPAARPGRSAGRRGTAGRGRRRTGPGRSTSVWA